MNRHSNLIHQKKKERRKIHQSGTFKNTVLINNSYCFHFITGCISAFLTQGDPSDPQESFRLWLQRKQEQQQRERQLVELQRLEQDSGYHLRSREECEHAFKL